MNIRQLLRPRVLVVLAAATMLALPAAADARRGGGTIKLDELTFDTSHANDPHVGPAFTVKFFDFDATPTTVAQVTFLLQPPTGRTVLLTDVVPLGSDFDPSSDLDAVAFYSLAPLLTAYEAKKQGYHVRVEITVVDGSAVLAEKSKVFWTQACASPPCTG